MAKKAIPDEVRARVNEIVEAFNSSEEVSHAECRYVAHFRGQFLYLGRAGRGRPSPICRLTYTGNINKWGFTIYKYSDEAYDPEECMFPGIEHVDGTIQGAMRAGLEAYPC